MNHARKNLLRVIASLLALILCGAAVVWVLLPSKPQTVSVEGRTSKAVKPKGSPSPRIETIPLARASKNNPSTDAVTMARQTKGSTPELIAWLEQWTVDVKARKPTSDQRLHELSVILQRCNISFAKLNALARQVAYVEGERAAAPLYQASVDRAEKELAAFKPGDKKARPIIDALWAMGRPLWNLKDWKTGEKMYALMIPWDPKQPKQARTAGYCHAEMQYMQERCLEAAAVVDTMLQTSAASLPAVEKAKWHYAKGLYLFSAERHSDAIADLSEAAAQQRRPHTNESVAVLGLALLRCNRITEAKATYDRLYSEHADSVLATQLRMEFSARLEHESK